ncbi:MAG TPA: hypothetical protein VFM37_08165, partial [Pseudonocardiaceae bacterium]|nr:hypothetical protein [Pseudonocardiaceae bacterium]
FKIRVQEHAASVDALKREIIGSAGYSAGTFGLDGEGQAVTATEIASRDRRSLITRDRKIRYARVELSDLLETWTHVDVAQYKSGIRPGRPLVEWPDAVSVDPLTQAQTLVALDTAGAISTEEKVRTLHPDWDDVMVAEEVARIKEDAAPPPMEDPDSFTGGKPDRPPPAAGGKDQLERE